VWEEYRISRAVLGMALDFDGICMKMLTFVVIFSVKVHDQSIKLVFNYQ